MKGSLKVTVLLFLLSLNLVAQQTKKNIKLDTNSKEKVEAYFLKAESFSNQELDSAIFYALKASNLSKKIGYDSLLIESTYFLGVSYLGKYDFEKVINPMITLDSLALIHNNLHYRYMANRSMAISYVSMSQNQKSTEYFTRALNIAIEQKDYINIASSYTNIGRNYMLMGQNKIAESYFIKALNTYESNNLNEAEYAYKISILYDNLASVYGVFKNKEKAFFYLNKEIEIMKKHNVYNPIAIGRAEGRLQFNFGDYKKSVIAFEKQFNASLRIKDTLSIMESSIFITKSALKLKDYNKAKLYFEKILTIEKSNPDAVNLNNLLSFRQEFYYLGTSIYQNTGDLEMALKYSNKLNETLNLLNEKKIDSIFVAQGARFEATEKEKEIVSQKLVIAKEKGKSSKLIYFSTSAGLISFLFGLFFYFKQKEKRNKIQFELNKEIEFTKFRTRFLETISHEIRTPITLINGYLNRIKEQNDISEKTDEYATQALNSTKKVLKNANEVLSLLKLEKNELRLNKTPNTLNKFVSELFFSFKNRAQEEQQSLVYKTNITDTLVVKFDYEKLETILNNLIFNALKYSPKNTKISFETYLSYNNLIFKVKDEGIGIAPKELKNVFKRFYQTKDNKTVGGMGIGLSIVKELATFLGGSVSVKSTLGSGSEFTATLPAEVYHLKEHKTNTLVEYVPAIVSEIPRKEINKSKVRILLVEDDKSMSRYLSEILIPHFNFDISHNGNEALEKVKQTHYDLILSDLMMPEMDGFQFKEALNKIKDYENIPFIILSASTLSENRIKGFTIGINDYLTKPFNERELIARINNLLANKVAQEETFKIADESDITIDYSNSFNAQLIGKITAIINKNIENDEFKVDDLASECGYSQRQLSRMLLKITGMSPVKFILEIRLLKAYELLINNSCPTIKEVKYSVGINSSPYFNAKFTERFGLKPSELLMCSVDETN